MCEYEGLRKILYAQIGQVDKDFPANREQLTIYTVYGQPNFYLNIIKGHTNLTIDISETLAKKMIYEQTHQRW